MKIAVVQDTPRPGWTARRLLKAIELQGHRPIYLMIQYISAGIGTNCPLLYQGRCLQLDAMVLRSLGRTPAFELILKRIAVLQHAADEGITIVNPVNSMLLARDKYTSLRLLARKGIPVPRTLLTEDPYEALRVVHEWGDIVIKPLSGTMGLGSYRARDVDMAYRIINAITSLGQPVYVQEFIEKKNNRDIRAFVVGDKVIAAVYRIAAPGSWKTNVAQGARTEPAQLNEDVHSMAVKATKILGLYYAGVDLAETRDGYVVFEVNAAPMWRGLQQATGVDPAPEIIRMVVELVKH